MPAPHLPTTPADLGLPLRDLLRGARRTLHLPGGALKPAIDRLPAPVGAFLHRVAGLMPDLDQDARPVARADLDLVIRGLDGDKGRDISRAFARVLAHAMDRVLDHGGDDALLVSETLAAITFGDLDAPDRFAAAADLWGALSRGHVIAVAPGTPIGTAPEDLARIDAALHATFLWLLCDRPGDEASEDEILALCVALAAATEAERTTALAHPETLAGMLASQAGVI